MDARDWDQKYAEKPLLWSAEPNRFVADEVSKLEPGTALDLACGEGRNAVWMAEQGWEVTGVDFSGVAINRARGMAVQRGVEVRFVDADLREWEPRHPFDLVLIAYLHLPEPDRSRMMEKATSWVAPGGHLLLVGHDVATAGVSGPPDPEVLWDPETAARLAGDLEVLFAESRPRETDTGETALDTVMLARRPR
ncbi:MAG: class I SAM-dependent methyltransferase [Acidimicrobiia bacterium]